MAASRQCTHLYTQVPPRTSCAGGGSWTQGTTQHAHCRHSQSEQINGYLKPVDYMFKIITIGDAGVGKSSLIRQYTDGSITPPPPNNFHGPDFRMRKVNVDGKSIKLQIWDTSGQERYRALPFGFYRGSHGVMAVYDVTDQKSFNNVKRWISDCGYHTSEDTARLLVGNKADETAKKVVHYATAKEYADELNIPFLETSAKDNINVEQAFITLAAVVKTEDPLDIIHVPCI